MLSTSSNRNLVDDSRHPRSFLAQQLNNPPKLMQHFCAGYLDEYWSGGCRTCRTCRTCSYGPGQTASALAACRVVRVLITNLAEILNSKSTTRDMTSTQRRSLEPLLPALLRLFLQQGANPRSQSDVQDTQQMEPETHTCLSSV